MNSSSVTRRTNVKEQWGNRRQKAGSNTSARHQEAARGCLPTLSHLLQGTCVERPVLVIPQPIYFLQSAVSTHVQGVPTALAGSEGHSVCTKQTAIQVGDGKIAQKNGRF